MKSNANRCDYNWIWCPHPQRAIYWHQEQNSVGFFNELQNVVLKWSICECTFNLQQIFSSLIFLAHGFNKFGLDWCHSEPWSWLLPFLLECWICIYWLIMFQVLICATFWVIIESNWMCYLCVIIAAMLEHGVINTRTRMKGEVGQQPISFHHPETILVTFWYGGLLVELRTVQLSGWLWHYGWAWLELPSSFRDESYMHIVSVFVHSWRVH